MNLAMTSSQPETDGLYSGFTRVSSTTRGIVMSRRRGETANRTRRELLRTIGAGAAIVGLGGARILCAQDASRAQRDDACATASFK